MGFLYHRFLKGFQLLLDPFQLAQVRPVAERCVDSVMGYLPPVYFLLIPLSDVPLEFRIVHSRVLVSVLFQPLEVLGVQQLVEQLLGQTVQGGVLDCHIG